MAPARNETSGEPASWCLKLCVAGQTPRSLAAIATLKRTCDEYIGERCTIEVIDLIEPSQLPREDDVIAIPTTVRQPCAPIRKIIGDLSNVGRVLVGLEIVPETARGAKRR